MFRMRNPKFQHKILKIFEMNTISFLVISCLSLTTIDGEEEKLFNMLFIPANGTTTPDFETLVHSTTLVDKTKMISDFFNHAPAFNYITAPRKFGKSMNIDMIKRFVEIEVNKTTFELNLIKNTTKNYKIFMKMPHRFLHISTEPEIINKHMAEYPVIHVSFKNISGVHFVKMIKEINERIYEAYYVYDWLFKTHKYMTVKDNLPKKLMVEKIYSKEATETDIAVSLYYLSEILHDIFQRKVILFVDDFDDPVISALNQLEVNAYRVIEFMNRIIEELRPPGGKHLSQFFPIGYAIFSGRSMIARAPQSKLVELPIKHWRFLDDHVFTQYYGLTVRECMEILDYHHVFTEEERPVVEMYYYGYVSQWNNTSLYNTYSIMQYLLARAPNYPNMENALQNYWAESGSIVPNFHKILDVFQNIRKRFLDALVRKKVYFELTLNVTVEEVEKIPLLIKTREDIKDHPEDLFFSYLFENGYFSFTDTPNYFAIPNREIGTELERDFIKYYKERNQLDLDPVADSIDLLLKSQDTTKDVVDKFEQNLNNLLQSAFKPITRRKFFLQEFDIPGLIYLAAKSRKYEYVTGEDDIIRLTGRLGVYKTESNIMISNAENEIALILEIRSKHAPVEAKDVVERYRPMKIRPNVLKLMGVNIESVNKTTVEMVRVIALE